MAYFDGEAARRLEALYKTEAIMRRRKTLLQTLQLVPGERVLHIGAGSGFVALDMADPARPNWGDPWNRYQRIDARPRANAVCGKALGEI